ncbi:heme ABC exporter ATP-binding protein CcmA [Aestuariivirga sp.]|uniref:heme ABC exporter ATP-binding protein CcmA n=1 Tax=Aestuariivirga sp. TaxID=2650926 RepID=UPI0039E50A79
MNLRGEQLACERGGRVVFRNVGFTIAPGEMLALTGPNGSGKSSLLRLISGLNQPLSGRLSLDGGNADLTVGQHAHYIAHAEAIKTALTVRENLNFWAAFLGGGDVDKALGAFDLTRLEGYPAGLLSSGQKRRLALARLVAVKRVLWLLDEPTVGLDAASQQRLSGVMRAHLQEGGMIIAATHTELGLKARHTLDLGMTA